MGDDQVVVVVRFAIALLTTVTSANPASWILRRSTEAPMADEPMPASQANTMVWIGPSCRAAAGAGQALEADDFLPFMASICAVAPAQVALVLAAVELQQHRADQEGDQGGAEDAERDAEEARPRRLRVDREDRARRRRRAQAGRRRARSRKMPVMPPAMVARISLRLHQHVGEVDLVDAAEELDDRAHRAPTPWRCRLPKNV